ncbi:hypothetical protein BDW74DRAFT_183746 [Aspergillus multicolor]|uniref:uncharacterized protein n=1 Tax=Aspergillus multicolor TaxID=41759 RepID=UPI003CCD8EC1
MSGRLLLTCLWLGALATASGILEVDLVFPQNTTYTPTEWFPVVFGFQSPSLAPLVDLDISFSIKNRDNASDIIHWPTDLRWTNETTSEDPYLFYAFFSRFRAPGRWDLTWHVHYKACNEFALGEDDRAEMVTNSTGRSMLFTIADDGDADAEGVDLVAATSEDSCPGAFGVPINVTDQTIRVPAGEDWANGNMCAVVASSSAPTPDPCRVDISKEVVESMEAEWRARLCRGANPPEDCPAEGENAAAQGVVVMAGSVVLAAVGAAGFILR